MTDPATPTTPEVSDLIRRIEVIKVECGPMTLVAEMIRAGESFAASARRLALTLMHPGCGVSAESIDRARACVEEAWEHYRTMKREVYRGQ